MDSIDVHFHIVPPRFVDLLRRGALREIVDVVLAPDVDRLLFRPPPGVAIEPDTSIRPHLYDARLILDALDRRGLDAAAVSPAPEFFLYWAPPALGELIARTVNDGMAELARAYPDRLLPLATLPMQDPARAARELERAITVLGLRGAALCTHVNGADLDGPAFGRCWRRQPASAHPCSSILRTLATSTGSLSTTSGTWLASRRSRRWLPPGSVMSGVFEELPELRVILAHGGGYFPYQIGRLDHGYQARPELQARLSKPPSHYLGNLYADSLIHDGRALRFLIDRFGADHVVLGSDYPFDMGCESPVAAVREIGLPPEQERAIVGGTLARVLGIG